MSRSVTGCLFRQVFFFGVRRIFHQADACSLLQLGFIILQAVSPIFKLYEFCVSRVSGGRLQSAVRNALHLIEAGWRIIPRLPMGARDAERAHIYLGVPEDHGTRKLGPPAPQQELQHRGH